MTVRKLSFERFVKAEEFKDDEPKLECFPSLPLHSKNKLYKAEIHKLKDDEDDCNKAYPKAPRMTPGLAHIFLSSWYMQGIYGYDNSRKPRNIFKISFATVAEKCEVRKKGLSL